MGEQHRAAVVSEEERDREDPTIGFDYFYLFQEEADSLPHLGVVDSKFSDRGATTVQAKGPNTFAVLFMVGYVRDLGFKRAFMKCDNEPAIVALRTAVIQKCQDLELMPVGPPEGDHRKNGLAAVNVREIKRMMRTQRVACESNLGVKLRNDHPALTHLAWFSAMR